MDKNTSEQCRRTREDFLPTGIQDVVLTDGKSVEECLEWKNVLERLAEYEDLEEQGKLLKLPCAVGDTVYRFYTVNDETKIYEHRLTTLTNIVNITEAGEIGKTVFLTQKEAEAALKELQTLENWKGDEDENRRT